MNALTPVGARILVVEDEPEMLRVLRLSLEQHQYQVLEAASGELAVRLVFEEKPALVLLDLGLPDRDGLDVTRHVREHSEVPIMVLSARSAERDIVQALDSGANDYITKPYRERELFARIRALLRAFSRLPEREFTIGRLRVEPALRKVFVEDRDAKLSVTEYRLFATLLRASGAALTHRQLLKEVWGPGRLQEVQYLRVYMRYLREKLEPDPANPRYLLTEPGIGYRLSTGPEQP